MMTNGSATENPRGALGRFGEETAARYLLAHGYEVLARNWRCGREGELDVVALSPQRDCVVVVEVKTRRSTQYGSPLEAVTWAKARRLRRLAGAWCQANEPSAPYVRIDVIGVLVLGDRPPQITHVEAVGS
ncbi:YraN family protein [Demetria terragena]|uniref:YraN family protein n=1 Tax=Demetria terragena TaxID=63959 RepID=UPI000377A2EF|nr:YraN family protein [Demetria terragena]